jgi:hypothetical protein
MLFSNTLQCFVFLVSSFPMWQKYVSIPQQGQLEPGWVWVHACGGLVRPGLFFWDGSR